MRARARFVEPFAERGNMYVCVYIYIYIYIYMCLYLDISFEHIVGNVLVKHQVVLNNYSW